MALLVDPELEFGGVDCTGSLPLSANPWRSVDDEDEGAMQSAVFSLLLFGVKFSEEGTRSMRESVEDNI